MTQKEYSRLQFLSSMLAECIFITDEGCEVDVIDILICESPKRCLEYHKMFKTKYPIVAELCLLLYKEKKTRNAIKEICKKKITATKSELNKYNKQINWLLKH